MVEEFGKLIVAVTPTFYAGFCFIRLNAQKLALHVVAVLQAPVYEKASHIARTLPLEDIIITCADDDIARDADGVRYC